MSSVQSPHETTSSGKPKRTIDSLSVENRFRNVIRLFLAGEMPDFGHQRHVHVASILHRLPFGRELMHLGLQTMAYRNFVPDKYKADLTNQWWDKVEGMPLPDPEAFADLPGGACGRK